MKNLINVIGISPETVYVGNPTKNTQEIMKYIYDNKESDIIVFPELSLTGYSCKDLFKSQLLIDKTLENLKILLKFTNTLDEKPLIIVGSPVLKDNKLYDCQVIIRDSEIIGIVPKIKESGVFTSGQERLNNIYIFENNNIPFTPNLMINDLYGKIKIGFEISDDMFCLPNSNSVNACLNGANIIINSGACENIIGQKKKIINHIKDITSSVNCSYLYVSCGRNETSTNYSYDSCSILIQNGKEVKQIDLDEIESLRKNNKYFKMIHTNYNIVNIDMFGELDKEYKNDINLYPFIPKENLTERICKILKIQASGLATRLRKINCDKVCIGISGGLDSTLALIVAIESFKINNYDTKNIIGITMPCFGTTNKTLENSKKLMDVFNITSLEINIRKSCEQHLKDINHPIDVFDITFENVQARERTQILMDIANQENAIVVGTGDLSELALGWCTYNGDHMSMYGVNCSIPKTLVRKIVEEYINICDIKNVKNVLLDICNTPISPELLPPNKDGNISQKTENSIGSYVTHDFCLYYFIKYGYAPSKIFELYINALTQEKQEINKEKIKEDMKKFFTRFFTQQFKKNCVPDGIIVGNINLSPENYHLISDCDKDMFVNDVDFYN